jgi:GxxExxY protein
MSDESSRRASHAGRALLHGALTGEIIGVFFDVYNGLRWGFLEAVYAGALEIEFLDHGISYRREAKLDVRYKGRVAGIYRADFLVEERVVLELKASVAIGEPDKRQLLNYLRVTGMPLGLLLHFGPEPRVVRLINT